MSTYRLYSEFCKNQVNVIRTFATLPHSKYNKVVKTSKEDCPIEPLPVKWTNEIKKRMGVSKDNPSVFCIILFILLTYVIIIKNQLFSQC